MNRESDVLPPAVAVPAKKPFSLLPTLVVLFLVSYGLMATLVVEQARTIDNQRSLVLTLFGDSGELTALKGKLSQQQRAQAGLAAKPHSGAQAQGPAAAPAPPAAHAQVMGPQKDAKKDGSSAHMQKPAPEKPPSASADSGDVRRTLLAI